MLISICVAAVSVSLLYRSAMDSEMERLKELVQSQARLIRAVARFDARFSREYVPGGASGATFSQIRRAFNEGKGFGKTGEFVLGRRAGNRIEFLTNLRHFTGGLAPIPLNSLAAAPMQRALNGGSGVMIGPDYRSVETIAAYEPLPELDAGLVAKVDLKDFRNPFFRASLISVGVMLVVISLGGLLLKQIETHLPAGHHGPDFLTPESGISPMERFFYQVLVMSIVAGAVIATPTVIIYNSSMEMSRSDLAEMANSQARLIGSVARFDARFSSRAHPGGAGEATLTQVRNSMAEQQGFGQSGEFVLGQLEGRKIVFLLKPRHLDHPIPPIQMHARDAEPMRRALQGATGVMTGPDYRGVEVLAAHRPVPELNLGLVAKMDVAELRGPFVDSVFITGWVAFFAVLLGVLSLKKSGVMELWAPEMEISGRKPVKGERKSQKISYTLIAFVSGLGLVILGLDIVTPLGVAGGVPFVGFILAGWWLPERRHIFILAVVASVFVVAGYFLAPAGGILWVVLTNRFYAILAIWVTALILGIAKASETAREKQADELRMLSLAVEHTPASVLITGVDGTIEYVNLKFTEVTGFDRDYAIGKTPGIIKSGETPVAVYEDLWQAITSGREWHGELLNRKKSGELYWENVAILPIISNSGEIIHFVSLQEDITKRKQAEDHLKHLANHDHLTGLPSLRLCKDRLFGAVASARRNKTMAALMFIDLDGFKAVNDTFGHETGDRLLKEVAARLTACVREVDTVARIGGDEFLIVLTDVTARSGVEKVAKSVIRAIDRPFLLRGRTAGVGASIGIALYPNHGEKPEDLLKKADEAMYRVKRRGKNSYGFATG